MLQFTMPTEVAPTTKVQPAIASATVLSKLPLANLGDLLATPQVWASFSFWVIRAPTGSGTTSGIRTTKRGYGTCSAIGEPVSLIPTIRCRTILLKCQTRHVKDHRITVRFSPEMRRRLKAAARRSGTRESDLVRTAVELQLAAEESSLTAYDHAKKAGLIGAAKGGVRDLSTNPKYFDGFGGS
jgi:predicted DNA-binding protein